MQQQKRSSNAPENKDPKKTFQKWADRANLLDDTVLNFIHHQAENIGAKTPEDKTKLAVATVAFSTIGTTILFNKHPTEREIVADAISFFITSYSLTKIANFNLDLGEVKNRFLEAGKIIMKIFRGGVLVASAITFAEASITGKNRDWMFSISSLSLAVAFYLVDNSNGRWQKFLDEIKEKIRGREVIESVSARRSE